MKITVLYPCRPPEERHIPDREFFEVAESLIDDTAFNVTTVLYDGKLRKMLVGDRCSDERFPYNVRATAAYLANCWPGTQWRLGGVAIVYDEIYDADLDEMSPRAAMLFRILDAQAPIFVATCFHPDVVDWWVKD